MNVDNDDYRGDCDGLSNDSGRSANLWLWAFFHKCVFCFVCNSYLANVVYTVSHESFDSHMAWNTWTVMLWLVHSAKRLGGKLATFTVFNLIANIIYTVITVALFYFFPCVHVAMAFRRSVCHLGEAQWEQKAMITANWLVALFQLCESPVTADQNFWHVRNPSDHQIVCREQHISPRSPLYTAG